MAALAGALAWSFALCLVPSCEGKPLPVSGPRDPGTDWMVIDADYLYGPPVDVNVFYPTLINNNYGIVVSLYNRGPGEPADTFTTPEGTGPLTPSPQPTYLSPTSRSSQATGNHSLGLPRANKIKARSSSNPIARHSSNKTGGRRDVPLDPDRSRFDSQAYRSLASSGFIVLSIPVSEEERYWLLDTLEETLAWLQDSLEDYMDYEVNWDRSAMLCEKESCSNLLDLIEEEVGLAKAFVFVEPDSSVSYRLPPIDGDTPLLVLAAQRPLPSNVVRHTPSQMLYDSWECPKYLVNWKPASPARRRRRSIVAGPPRSPMAAADSLPAEDGLNNSLSANLPVDLTVDLTTDLSANLSSNIPADLPANHQANLSNNVSTNVSTNLPANISNNVSAKPPGNLPANLPANLPGNLPANPPTNLSALSHPSVRPAVTTIKGSPLLQAITHTARALWHNEVSPSTTPHWNNDSSLSSSPERNNNESLGDSGGDVNQTAEEYQTASGLAALGNHSHLAVVDGGAELELENEGSGSFDNTTRIAVGTEQHAASQPDDIALIVAMLNIYLYDMKEERGKLDCKNIVGYDVCMYDLHCEEA